MTLYRDDAVVLRTHKLGEADRIVTLFSRNRGKIRAVAKGVRRTKSKFGARLEPASVIHGQFYEGRNLDIVTQAETAQRHIELRRDLDRFGRAAIMLEVVDQISLEDESNPALYKLLVGALAELERDGNPLVIPAFAAKLLTLEGVQPLLDTCVRCGEQENLIALDLHLGGILCDACSSGEPITEAARLALCDVFAGRVRHVLDTTSPAIAAELEAIGSRMIEQHLERRLRSVRVLDQSAVDATDREPTPQYGHGTARR